MKKVFLLFILVTISISTFSFSLHSLKTALQTPLNEKNLSIKSVNVEPEIKSVNLEGINVTNMIQENSVEFNKNEISTKSDLSTNKPSPSGITWVKTYGGDKGEYLNCIQKTSDGGFITAGWTSSFGAGGKDFLVMKLDAYGEVVWSKTYGGQYDDNASSIIQTSDGGYIVAGNTFSFGNANYGYGYDDVLVLKITSYGDIIWAKKYGGKQKDNVYVQAIKQTADGGYILAINSESYGNHTVITKLTSTGEVTWAKEIGTYYSPYVGYSSIIITSDGGYAFTAACFGIEEWDILIVKLTSNGDLTWAKQYDVWRNQSFSIIQTSDGGYIINGVVYGRYGVSAGYDDVFLIKINSIGGIEWAKIYGGKGNERLNYFEKTSDGGYIGAGMTDSISKDFCPGGICHDLLMMKFNTNGGVVWSKTYKVSKELYPENEAQHINDGNYVIQDNDGGYIAVGGINFNTPKKDTEALIIKVDSNGNLEGGSNYIKDINFTFNTPKEIGMPKLDHLVFNSISIGGQNASVTTQSPTKKANLIVGTGSPNPNKPPLNLRAYPGDNKVYLEWNPPEDTSNLLGYYLYRAKVSGGYNSPAHDFFITDTKYIDENVENGIVLDYHAVYCPNCNLTFDRDEVASLNILNKGMEKIKVIA